MTAGSGPFVHWFGTGTAETALLGGKGAALERLVRAGLPVPPAFCLTTAAYTRYLDAHGLTPRVRHLVADLPAESARVEFSGLAHGYAFPDDLASALRGAVDALAALTDASRLLAVRSSAIGEDAVEASFAGQHESVLGVTPERVDEAVRVCWASLWSQRAVAYRLRRGLGFSTMAMAAIVQSLVPAEASAVAFTTNPLTGRDDEILVNAAWGLGEAIVSGDVTPDTFVLDKSALSVRRAEAGQQHMRFIASASGGVKKIPLPAAGPALAEPALRALGDLSREVEALFGRPMDLEAAWAGGRWYLLQARPITTR